MRIEKIESGYTEIINYGRYALFIHLDDEGPEHNYNDLVEQAIHFNRIIILGDEPFLQKEELTKFIKKLIKQNDNLNIEVYTKGIKKPTSIGNFNKVTYNVFLQLKTSEIEYEKRINPSIINWFNLSDANFIFEVNNEDDVDEVVLLLQDVGIPKHKVFLAPKDNYDLIFQKCRTYNFNFAPWIKFEND